MNIYTYDNLEWALCKAAKFLGADELIEYICQAEELIMAEKNPFILQRKLELIATTRKTDQEMGPEPVVTGYAMAAE